MTAKLKQQLARLAPGEDVHHRGDGRDWPLEAETMIGYHRLNQLESAVRAIIRNEVPGDLIETGVWRGGACILMRALLRELGDTGRIVWVADSFQGVPPPSDPHDAGDTLHQHPELVIPQEQVQANFARYDLLDDQVRFLPGWFRDTLPDAPIRHLALMRLDGDLYESTMQALTHLYPKLSPGGYVIVDDYGAMEPCHQATDDYRLERGIDTPLVEIDWTGVYWIKP